MPLGLYLPPMEKVPDGTTAEQRKKMFEEYVRKLTISNPAHFNEDGTMKSFWQYFAKRDSQSNLSEHFLI